jgi:hypothetical protein
MLPPKSDWMAAPTLPMIERERTMMPRTMPRLRTTRCPGSSKAVVMNSLSTAMAETSVCGLHRLRRAG